VAGKVELTILLTRIMMPFLLLVSVAAVAMGMLNAEQRFVPPALAPALFNLAAIVVGGCLWLLGIGQTRTAAIAWAAATMLGGVLQLLAQWLPLFRSGYRPRLTSVLTHEGLRAVLWAMAPATIGLGATQLNIYISSSFASQQRWRGDVAASGVPTDAAADRDVWRRSGNGGTRSGGRECQ
jgi:putative peptidoglycan lipid II flippase